MHLAHGDNFAAKRMRKLTQRRAVDYTSTVVRYMQFGPMPIEFVFITIQLLPTLSWLIQGLPELLGIRTNIGLKRMKEIDPKTFHDTCKSRFPPDEAEIQATTLYSSWQENLKNPDWHPIFRRN
ncbi:hypothetical protein E1A91_D10G121600v1 [Gossypium mustelinum]|uniref:Factor of DNA methylation 1-5/IDN2 domain-containing protein n=1 Tax=Gossypium mustelinum TaxID=34275 RepID=A0A5D2T641_GOSMU|nr:hypothetical protein E1A91_D10G121600v1 [Gossypium mustelinum]